MIISYTKHTTQLQILAKAHIQMCSNQFKCFNWHILLWQLCVRFLLSTSDYVICNNLWKTSGLRSKEPVFLFFFFWSVHLRTKRNQMTTTQQTNKMHCWDLNNFVHNNKFQFLILTVFFSFAFFASFVNRIKIAFAFTYLIFSFWTKFLFSAEAHIPYCTY